MLQRFLLAAAFAAGLSSAAQAQLAKTVATCGAQTLRIGDASSLFQDSTGVLCSTAGSGGGGSAGSVTPAGTNGTSAQAIQGINGGVPVPVTGTFTGSPVTGTNERDVTDSRTLDATSTASQQTYTLNGQSTLSFNFSGLAASGATVSFYQSNDWNGTTGTFTGIGEVNTGTGVASLTRNTDGQSAIGIEGTKAIRVQVTTAGTGAITLATNISVRSRYQALRSPLPPGSNVIGSVAQSGAWTFGLSGPIPTGSNVIGAVTQSGGPWSVSGTVTANLGTLNGAALDTSVQQVKTTLGSPFQAGGSIGNTAFGISGTLPAYAAPPTFNVGTTNGLALDSTFTTRLGTLGQKTMAGSAPVTFASDQSALPVTGTTTAQDALVPAGSPYSQSAAATLFSVDTTGYQSITVQLSGTFVGTVIYEASNDNTNWTAVVGQSPSATNVGANGSDAAPGLRGFPVGARYFRARVSAYTSGTIVAVPTLRSSPLSFPPTGVAITSNPTLGSGTQNIGSLGVTTSGSGIGTISRIPSAAASTNLTQAKGSSGRLYKAYACNTTTTAKFLKFYDATTVTVGTTAIKLSRALEPSGTSGVPRCQSFDGADIGYSFGTGIAYALTGGNADNDTTALAAGDVTQVSVEVQ